MSGLSICELGRWLWVFNGLRFFIFDEKSSHAVETYGPDFVLLAGKIYGGGGVVVDILFLLTTNCDFYIDGTWTGYSFWV